MGIWKRETLIIILVLLVLAPLFGVILADIVGYHEPLDLAAEKLGLSEWDINWTPFTDYSVPGVDPIVGYVISGIIGIVIIYALGMAMLWFSKRKENL